MVVCVLVRVNGGKVQTSVCALKYASKKCLGQLYLFCVSSKFMDGFVLDFKKIRVIRLL